MFTLRKFRQTVVCSACGVRSEVVLEVVVERICQFRLAVDYELHVVSHSCSGGVDAVAVGYLSHKVRRRVHSVAILERRRVQIAVHGRTNRVVVSNVAASYGEAVAVAVHHHCMFVIDGKDVNESLFVRVTDILGYRKGECKLTVHNLTVATIEHSLAVGELHWVVGSILIVVAYHRLFTVAHQKRCST